jgi:hypothetical protein
MPRGKGQPSPTIAEGFQASIQRSTHNSVGYLVAERKADCGSYSNRNTNAHICQRLLRIAGLRGVLPPCKRNPPWHFPTNPRHSALIPTQKHNRTVYRRPTPSTDLQIPQPQQIHLTRAPAPVRLLAPGTSKRVHAREQVVFAYELFVRAYTRDREGSQSQASRRGPRERIRANNRPFS